MYFQNNRFLARTSYMYDPHAQTCTLVLEEVVKFGRIRNSSKKTKKILVYKFPPLLPK